MNSKRFSLVAPLFCENTKRQCKWAWEKRCVLRKAAWPGRKAQREQEVAELRGGVDLVGLMEALGMEDDYEIVDVRVPAGEEDVEVEEEVNEEIEEEWVGGEWVTRKRGRDGDDEEGGTGGGGASGIFGMEPTSGCQNS